MLRAECNPVASGARMTDAARPATAYALTPEQEATLELADKFGRAELAPLSRKMDDEEWWPPEVFPKLGRAGLLGVTIPAAEGGPGLDVFSSALILQGLRAGTRPSRSRGSRTRTCA